MAVYADPSSGGGAGVVSSELEEPSVLYLPGQVGGESPAGMLYDYTPLGVDLGKFLREYWYCHESGSSAYFWSSGFGGAHPSGLDGFVLRNGYYALSGNTGFINIGTSAYTPVAYESASTVTLGEWAHWALSFTTDTIRLWHNGILTGVYATPAAPYVRGGLVADVSQPHGFIGGSTHNKAIGRLAAMRHWDRNKDPIGNADAAFTPLPQFSRWWDHASSTSPCDLLFDMSQGRGNIIPDLSPGISGVLNHAFLNNFTDLTGAVPYFVVDPTSPVRWDGGTGTIGERSRTPTTPPSGAVVYDSFERANSTPAFQGNAAALGSVEVGVSGQLGWTPFAFPGKTVQRWGILDGWACYLGTATNNGVVVETGITAQKVSIKRSRMSALALRQRFGIIFRYIDASNFMYAISYDNAGETVYVGKMVAGVETQVIAAVAGSPASTWETFEINVTAGNVITVKTDGNTVGTATDSANAAGTKAGLCHYGWPVPTISSGWRAKDFTVKAAT